jgi:ribosome-binding factor A
MPREFNRSRRVEEAIQRILGQAIAAKVRDPRLAGLIITDVRVSRDLGVARVHYALLTGTPVGPELSTALRSATGFLRSTLARELRVRRVPELRFLPDESLERSRSLGDLIDRAVAGQRDASEGTDEPAERVK